MNSFGQELRAFRMRHSLTLKVVADAANRSVSSISDIEHKRRQPLSATEIQLMCDRLELPGEVDRLLNAAAHGDCVLKVELQSPLEKDLYVTFRRSIESQTIGENEIQKIIKELKERLLEREKVGRDKIGEN